jgi:hypothetical protein
VELTVLTVADCPHGPVLEERLAEVLGDRRDVVVRRRVIVDEADAVEAGLRGSPTLLVDGVDRFAEPGRPVSVSCRMFRDADGGLAGAPSVAELRTVLDSPDAVRGRSWSAEPWSDPLGRAGAGRLAPVAGGLRAVQRAVLTAFATTGRAPTAAELTAAAPGDPAAVLARLHTADFLRLDTAGRIVAAYPFSAAPTAHVVRIDDGPEVFAMCAVDALGMAAMLGTGVRIRSADPGSGEPVAVRVPGPDAAATAVWEPATGVVFAGRRADCAPGGASDAPPPAVDMCCGYVNFFGTPGGAAAWARAHPEITGEILAPAEAERLGAGIFGPLLSAGIR